MPEKAKLLSNLISSSPWSAESNSIWMSTHLILERNFSHHKFPAKQSQNEQQTLLTSIAACLQKSPDLKKPTLLPAETLDPLEKELLFEHFLCLESFQHTGAGQGIVIDETGKFLALLNNKNHLELHLVDTHLQNTWNQLSRIESFVGKQLEFAYLPKFGYLTSDPKHCGTALLAHALLHLPALVLTGELMPLASEQKESEIEIITFEGGLIDPLAHFVILKNRYTLGVTEETVLEQLQTTALKLSSAENRLRTRLKEENKPPFKDPVARAHGLLSCALQLQTKEALEALSFVKLGLELGWLCGVQTQKIDELLLYCRKAHLAHLLNTPQATPEQQATGRVALLHEALKGVTVTG